jgi:hypothetical protein
MRDVGIREAEQQQAGDERALPPGSLTGGRCRPDIA